MCILINMYVYSYICDIFKFIHSNKLTAQLNIKSVTSKLHFTYDQTLLVCGWCYHCVQIKFHQCTPWHSISDSVWVQKLKSQFHKISFSDKSQPFESIFIQPNKKCIMPIQMPWKTEDNSKLMLLSNSLLLNMWKCINCFDLKIRIKWFCYT